MTQVSILIRSSFPADVAVTDETIAAVGPGLELDAAEIVDATGLHVLPGAVDAHVHFNDPGRADWEGWATGTSAAAAGGTTCVVDMPLNAHPPTLDARSFALKLEAARAAAVTDFAFWRGSCPATSTGSRSWRSAVSSATTPSRSGAASRAASPCCRSS
jgi:allantoinase